MLSLSTNLIFSFILAYLFGSIPTAVWVGKRFYKLDVREHGSGNAGATNTFRVLGKRAGVFVLIVDALKGFVAVKVVPSIFILSAEPSDAMLWPILLGCLAVFGHIFPIFAGFRGGKGIATLLGVVIGLHIPTALYCIGVFLISFFTTRIVSLSSMLAAIFFPVSIFLIFPLKSESLEYFSLIFCILVIVTHKQNIKRLLGGEEKKVSLKRNNKENTN
jgi:glycerol-3-phosphate acyltransferase PlsY